MSRIKYIITSSMVKIEDSEITSYGITCLNDTSNEQSIEDISTDKATVERAVNRFNKYKLSPHHFAEAVEDVLTDTFLID